MFSNKMDPNNAYLDIQSGSGGTEAQDWAEMLMRMYLKWGESKGFDTEVIEVSHGEVAGIKALQLSLMEIMLTVGCELKQVSTDW